MGSTAFARHYLRYRFLFLFLRLLRCFTSAGLASVTLCIQVTSIARSGYQVTPFGHPRFLARLQLPEAFRSLLRPSSPIGSKASSISPFFAPNFSQSYSLLSSRCFALFVKTLQYTFSFLEIVFIFPSLRALSRPQPFPSRMSICCSGRLWLVFREGLNPAKYGW